MKILILSDLHHMFKSDYEVLNNLEFEKDYDICLLLGDIGYNHLNNLKKTLQNIYGITGNHDDRESLDLVGITDINQTLINYKGYNIVGLSGSYKYKPNNNLSMLTQKESIDICSNLPKADIIISHDSCYHQMNNDEAHQGLKGLTEYIKRNKPLVHLFGHHHELFYEKNNNTHSFCVYRCGILDLDIMELVQLF